MWARVVNSLLSNLDGLVLLAAGCFAPGLDSPTRALLIGGGLTILKQTADPLVPQS